jgi:hypothetical protein
MLQRTAPSTPFLSIYLNDHRAGAVAGLARARSAAEQMEDPTMRQVLAEVADEIARDRDVLDEVIDRLDVRHHRVKMAVAMAGERIGRLKLNGRLLRRSPLSDLIEIEVLLAGIDAKRSLWAALDEAQFEALPDIDFVALMERASMQRGRLVPLHHTAAIRALAAQR